MTAVAWLIEQIDNKDMGEIPMWVYEFINQAKEMEKEQITSFAKLWEEKLLDGRIDSVDDLYNEIYGK